MKMMGRGDMDRGGLECLLQELASTQGLLARAVFFQRPGGYSKMFHKADTRRLFYTIMYGDGA